MIAAERRMAVDRTRAGTRAAWMLSVGALLSAGAIMAGRGIRWRSMWNADAVTLAAMAFLLLLMSLVTLAVLARGVRWAALAMWPRTTQVVISATGIRLELGPFGASELDWGRMQVELPAVDEDMPAMADDPVLPALHHVGVSGEICERVMKFCGVTPVELDDALRPFLPKVGQAVAK